MLRLLIAAAFIFLHARAGAQSIENTLAKYSEKYAQERTYIHYDKPVYAAGETIWFKAYLMQDILPALDSKTLYIDWIDEKGTVLSHTAIPVQQGAAHSQFDIPTTYSGAFIHVRAYTRWMLNFDSAFLYNRDIKVVGTTQRNVSKPAATITDLQFFPEGGDAIEGIKNNIAFLAADQWGRPVRITGVVQSSGAVVTTFSSRHDGMGSFYFMPQPGATYTATWKDAKGTAHTTALPTIKNTGVALQVAMQGAKRRFTLTRTSNVPEPLKRLHVVGTMRENFVFETGIDLTANATFSGLIPTETLPTGILTITVFDADWNAVAERITFVKNEDYQFIPALEVAHWGLNKRARNELQLTIPDSIEANLSVSVTDGAIAKDSSANIIAHLLLTSEVKGYVPQADYYFAGNTDSVNQALDLVMLTHGWRRFKWEEVVKGKVPVIKYPKDTTYLSLSGKLYGTQPGNAPTGIALFLKSKDSGSRMIMEPVKPDGTFNDPDAVFFDTLQVYYQVQPAKLFKNVDVGFMLNRLPALNYTAPQVPFSSNDTTGDYRLYLLAQERAKASELMKEKMLANVTVRAKTKSPIQALDEKYTSGLFGGSDSYQFDLVNDPLAASYPTIFNYLQGKVAGLQIGSGAQPSLQWRGGSPAVYLDEIVTNVDMLSSLSVGDIAYVKVFRPPFMGGFNGANGAIAIYTRKGGDVAATKGKGLNRNTITGYTPAKQFYAPNYDRIDIRNEQADFRTTLYWNPTVVLTPKSRTVTLVFYNNDVTKSFNVVVEGITKDGRLAHLTLVME